MALKLDHSTVAHCTPERVWRSFQNLELWPAWNRVIHRTRWVQGKPRAAQPPSS